MVFPAAFFDVVLAARSFVFEAALGFRFLPPVGVFFVVFGLAFVGIFFPALDFVFAFFVFILALVPGLVFDLEAFFLPAEDFFFADFFAAVFFVLAFFTAVFLPGDFFFAVLFPTAFFCTAFFFTGFLLTVFFLAFGFTLVLAVVSRFFAIDFSVTLVSFKKEARTLADRI